MLWARDGSQTGTERGTCTEASSWPRILYLQSFPMANKDILVNTTNAVGHPLQSAAVSLGPSLEVPVDTTYTLFPFLRVTLCPPKPLDLLHFAPEDPHDHSSKALSS